ncbi:MAG TPA: HNH endonuclease [Chthonomonadales bacterium]|nr:HNH endonuclease [Chthonomonadales bacterium]
MSDVARGRQRLYRPDGRRGRRLTTCAGRGKIGVRSAPGPARAIASSTRGGRGEGNRPRTKRCAYCGSTGGLTVDHVVPISQWRKYGVRRRVLDDDSNNVLACHACNEAKGCSDPRA